METATETKWVATVTGYGMGVFHVEAGTCDALEVELGELQSSIGRVSWTLEERPVGWACDGTDGCAE